MSAAALAELASTGVMRAGINLSNFLLVSGKSPSGEPEGVAPDMARAIAQRLNVPVAYVMFPRPGELADAADQGVWDIGLIAAEPASAKTIAFSLRTRRSRPRTWCPRARHFARSGRSTARACASRSRPGPPTTSGSAAISATPS